MTARSAASAACSASISRPTAASASSESTRCPSRNFGGSGNAGGGGLGAEDRRGAEFGERLEQFGRRSRSGSARR